MWKKKSNIDSFVKNACKLKTMTNRIRTDGTMTQKLFLHDTVFGHHVLLYRSSVSKSKK